MTPNNNNNKNVGGSRPTNNILVWGCSLGAAVALVVVLAWTMMIPCPFGGPGTRSTTQALQKFAATAAPRVLNVHMIPHTHDDVGWLKTVEQYYDGQNASIDDRGNVRDIITTTVEALLQSPSTCTCGGPKWRRSIAPSCTIPCATCWPSNNGVLSMADGACTMKRPRITLGVVPTVGWQLDPFGHSSTQASDMTARMGFDALYFGRIDYQDLQLRRERRVCEGLWQPSSAGNNQHAHAKLMDDSDEASMVPPVFWGLTGEYGGNYGGPPDFCFDLLCDDEPLVGNNQTRLLQRLVTFVQDIARQANQTQGNHIAVTMGMDFFYQNAHKNFANMDLLISSLLNFQDWNLLDAADYLGPRFDRIQIFYSTPEYYTAQKNAETVRYYQQHQHDPPAKPLWEVKQDDFFPYADCPHCYWTGYFTSRTAFKRLERVASAFLQAARQVDSLPPSSSVSNPLAVPLCDCGEFVHSQTNCPCTPPLYDLEDALGVAQHHDAVSGTAKQHVADDYSRRVQAGLDQASRYMAQRLKSLMLNESHSADTLSDLMYCQLLNETKCSVSQKATTTNDDIFVVVYNPIATERSTTVRLPVSTEDAIYEITSLGGHPTTQVATPVLSSDIKSGGDENDAAPYVLVFSTGLLPPVGAAAFRISVVGSTVHSKIVLTSLLSEYTAVPNTK